jgi:DNA-binding IclR family transcriptional regulator
MAPSAPNRSITRAFDLLVAVQAAAGPITLSDLARRVGLAKSTTSRLAATLVELGALESTDTGYRLGPLIDALHNPVHDHRSLLRAAARPLLRRLVDDIGEHAALTVIDAGDALYIAQEYATAAVDAGDWVGERHKPHAAAFGLVLMAGWSPARLRRYLSEPLASFTPDTTVEPDRLRERLRAIDHSGHAWTVNEFAEDVAGVAAPVHDPEGDVVASLGVFGPGYRFPGQRSRDEVATLVVEAADELSRHVAWA